MKRINPFVMLVVIVIGSYLLTSAALNRTDLFVQVSAATAEAPVTYLAITAVQQVPDDPNKPAGDKDLKLVFENGSEAILTLPGNQWGTQELPNKNWLFTSSVMGDIDRLWMIPLDNPTMPYSISEEASNWRTSCNFDASVCTAVIVRAPGAKYITSILFFTKEKYGSLAAPELDYPAARWELAWLPDQRHVVIGRVDKEEGLTGPDNSQLWIYDTKTGVQITDWRSFKGVSVLENSDTFTVQDYWSGTNQPLTWMPYTHPVVVPFCYGSATFYDKPNCPVFIAEADGQQLRNFHQYQDPPPNLEEF